MDAPQCTHFVNLTKSLRFIPVLLLIVVEAHCEASLAASAAAAPDSDALDPQPQVLRRVGARVPVRVAGAAGALH